MIRLPHTALTLAACLGLGMLPAAGRADIVTSHADKGQKQPKTPAGLEQVDFDTTGLLTGEAAVSEITPGASGKAIEIVSARLDALDVRPVGIFGPSVAAPEPSTMALAGTLVLMASVYTWCGRHRATA
jgi:hypothetical protein